MCFPLSQDGLSRSSPPLWVGLEAFPHSRPYHLCLINLIISNINRAALPSSLCQITCLYRVVTWLSLVARAPWFPCVLISSLLVFQVWILPLAARSGFLYLNSSPAFIRSGQILFGYSPHRPACLPSNGSFLHGNTDQWTSLTSENFFLSDMISTRNSLFADRFSLQSSRKSYLD